MIPRLLRIILTLTAGGVVLVFSLNGQGVEYRTQELERQMREMDRELTALDRGVADGRVVLEQRLTRMEVGIQYLAVRADSLDGRLWGIAFAMGLLVVQTAVRLFVEGRAWIRNGKKS